MEEVVKNEEIFFMDAEDVNSSYTVNVEENNFEIEALEDEVEEVITPGNNEKRDIVFESLHKANIATGVPKATSLIVRAGNNSDSIVKDASLIPKGMQIKKINQERVKDLFPNLPPPNPGKKYQILLIKRQLFKCTECLHSAESQEKLDFHVRKEHTKDITYKCILCEYVCSSKNVFVQHLRGVHGGSKPHECSFCDFASSSARNLIKHQTIHREDDHLSCTICPFIARYEKTLDDHLANHGAFDNIVRRRISKQPYFICAVCSWTSNCKNKVLLHLLHHPEQDAPSNLDVSIFKKYGIKLGEEAKGEMDSDGLESP